MKYRFTALAALTLALCGCAAAPSPAPPPSCSEEDALTGRCVDVDRLPRCPGPDPRCPDPERALPAPGTPQ